MMETEEKWVLQLSCLASVIVGVGRNIENVEHWEACYLCSVVLVLSWKQLNMAWNSTIKLAKDYSSSSANGEQRGRGPPSLSHKGKGQD